MRFPWQRYTIKNLSTIQKNIQASDIVGRRRKVRIALIDDQQFFQLDNLRSNQYEIFHIGNSSNILQVEPYDIIACDLRGVGENINEKLQGAGLIKEIKRIYPDKYVIAYSGSFARSKLVDVALGESDDNIAKSADLDAWMQKLDQAIEQVTDPVERWKRLRLNMLNSDIDANELSLAEHAYVKSVLKSDRAVLEKFLNKTELSADLKIVLRTLITSAIWAAIS